MPATRTSLHPQLNSAWLRAFGAMSALIGLSGLLGWLVDSPLLRSMIPGAVEMKANSAVGLILAGVALGILSRRATHRVPVAVVLALGVFTLGVLTLGEYAFGWQLGIDQVFFEDTGTRYSAFAGRMSPYTAAGFVAMGLALLTLATRSWPWLGITTSCIVTAIGLLALTGYFWGASELVTDQWLPPVPINTATALVCLGLGGLSGSVAFTLRLTRGDPVNRILFAALGAVVVFLLLGRYTYRGGAEYDEALRWVTHTHQVRLDISRLYARLADTEAAHRNYLITGDPAYRALWQDRVTLVHRMSDSLAVAMSDNPDQSERLARLDLLIGRRLLALENVANGFERAGLEAAAAEITAGAGLDAMTEIRAQVVALVQVEQDLLAQRRAAAMENRRSALVALLLMLTAGSIGLLLLLHGFLRAMQTRATAETLLRASEANLSVTLDSIGDGVLATDAVGRVTRLNPVAEELTGWTEREAGGQPADAVMRIINEETRVPARLPVADALASGTIHGLANHTVLIARDGRERAIADSCAPIRDRDGQIIGAVLVFRDVSDERVTQKALAASKVELEEFNRELEERIEERHQALIQSERRFAQLFEAGPDATLIVDEQARVVLANGRAGKLFQRHPSELPGVKLDDLIRNAAGDRVALHDMLGNDAEPRLFEERLIAVPREGPAFPVEISVGVLDTPEGRLAALAVRDLTERHQLENQLRQSAKMEAVGRLAGGIAHDFNNLITVINTTSELAMLELDEHDTLRAEFHTIRETGARAAEVTRQLLSFSRQQMLQPTVVDLNSIVTGLDPLLRRLIGEDVQFALNLARNLDAVHVDRTQIEQVLMNLAINSRDAMPGGGTLSIETDNVDLDESFANTHAGMRSGRHVMLAVSDTGVGMDEETRRNMFEPFYTTKATGKGTGLGLATVYGIVKQSGGDIFVYSEPGHGTTIKVYFPAFTGGPSEEPRPLPAPGRKGHETILVVEDEEVLRRIACRILVAHGYEVLDAGSGAAALQTLQDRGRPVDLVLTDVVMPGMSGRELSERIAKLHPGTKILFSSGYTPDVIVHHKVLDEHLNFIAKPYSLQALTAKVREVLDGK